MTSRNIVFTEPRIAKLLTEEVTPLGENDVMVKLAVSTVSSGTERANLIGDPRVSIYSSPNATEAQFPRRVGYCASGTVIQVGKNVDTVKVGDRVAVAAAQYREYLVVEAKHVYPIGDMAFEEAAVFYISTFPLAAVRKCRLEIGESAIVMGMGVLGLVAVKLLKAAGAAPVIAVDPIAEKRVKALESGADYALDPLSPDFAETVKSLTDGGANVGIEVTGITAGLDGILDCMAPFGRVALLGCTRHSDLNIDYYSKIHGPGITLIGAHTMARPKFESSSGWWTEQDDMKTMIRLVQNGRLSVAELVDETHSPAEAEQVFGRLAVEKAFPVVQFNWGMLE